MSESSARASLPVCTVHRSLRVPTLALVRSVSSLTQPLRWMSPPSMVQSTLWELDPAAAAAGAGAVGGAGGLEARAQPHPRATIRVTSEVFMANLPVLADGRDAVAVERPVVGGEVDAAIGHGQAAGGEGG